MRKNFAKEFLLEFLSFLEDKIVNDELLAEEFESIAKTIEENITLYATADDLARFYGKTKDAVNGIIKRNVVEKPRRNIVLHSFRSFSRKVPSSWRKKD